MWLLFRARRSVPTNHIRLSYAVSGDVIDEGVKRMREYFAKLG